MPGRGTSPLDRLGHIWVKQQCARQQPMDGTSNQSTLKLSQFLEKAHISEAMFTIISFDSVTVEIWTLNLLWIHPETTILSDPVEHFDMS